jgi:N-dimethylarginine dimethylaminohydrolase
MQIKVHDEVLSGLGLEAAANPTRLNKPSYLMNVPFSYSTGVANNVWMEEIPDEERRPHPVKAMRQFMELYHAMASEAVVFLLPATGQCGLQDLVFTANLGAVLTHLPDQNSVVISNYTSEPRRGETEVGVRYFESLGYNVFVAPHRFEGEAELKHLHSNVYLGGYGIRSELETYRWMEESFDMQVIPLHMDDPYLYHLDCSVFPLTSESTLLCTELYDEATVKAIEQQTEIIDVSADECFSGICNSVRLGNSLLNASNIHELKTTDEDYPHELAKNRRLEDIAVNAGFEVSYFNLSEYMKGGALLSCMIMHLNRNSYEFALI